MESSQVEQDGGGGGGDGHWEEDESERTKIFESENFPDSSNNRLLQLMEQNQREEEELEKEVKAAETGTDSFIMIKVFYSTSGVRKCRNTIGNTGITTF